MKKLVAFTLCTAVALGLGLATARAADPPAKPVKVETSGGKKAPVLFDHKKHGDLKCGNCHHTEKEGKFGCRSCHGLEDNATTKAPKIETAMHGKDKGKCFGCHRAEDAKNKLKCADCHKG